MKIRFAVFFVLVSLLSISSCFLRPGIQILKGPYLIYEGDNTRMTLLWQLDAETTCTVAWGTDTHYSSGSFLTSEYGGAHQYKYVISNLSKATKYYYRLKVKSSYYTGSFHSAPSSTAQDVKFLVYGDTRSSLWEYEAVCAQMVNTYINDPAFQTFTLHAGDFVSGGDKESDWNDEFFLRSKLNIRTLQSELPVQGCRGNHEGSGKLFYKYFPYPYEPGGFYWSFDYGPAHVAVIDQYVSYSPGSAQYAWLEKDLASTNKKWIFLLFHEPGWSAGGHANNASVQNFIQPLCLEYGVDIVFCGHNHYYARAVVQGVQHITSGGGGAPLHEPQYNSSQVVIAEQVYHFCEIEIKGSQLFFAARDNYGSVIDSFTL